MTNDVYICVDMQKDFVDGTLGSLEAQEIVPKCNEFLNKIEKKLYKEYLIYTMDTHDINYLHTDEGQKLPIPHCIKYTDGWNLAVNKIVDNVFFVEKTKFYFSDWYEFFANLSGQRGFDEFNVENIYLFGLDTDICVVSNAMLLKTLYPRKEIYIIEDLTAGSTPENKEAALKVAKACQINVIKSEDIK